MFSDVFRGYRQIIGMKWANASCQKHKNLLLISKMIVLKQVTKEIFPKLPQKPQDLPTNHDINIKVFMKCFKTIYDMEIHCLFRLQSEAVGRKCSVFRGYRQIIGMKWANASCQKHKNLLLISKMIVLKQVTKEIFPKLPQKPQDLPTNHDINIKVFMKCFKTIYDMEIHCLFRLQSEAVGRKCSVKKMFLQTLAQVLSCEFCEISKNTFSYITPPVAASVQSTVDLYLQNSQQQCKSLLSF